MRPTVRVKLATLCATIIVVGGVLLVSTVYLLVRAGLVTQVSARITAAQPARQLPTPPPTMTPTPTPTPTAATTAGRTTPDPDALAGFDPSHTMHLETARTLSSAMLTKLLVNSVVALLALAVLAAVAGWWLSGRALRPVNRITATARALSSDNLHQRIALAGPKDELTELADTFDTMLDRLESAFESQRRFIANASHELRTPLAIQRAAVQIGLAGEQSETVRRVSRQLLDANRRSERLIDGLLALARSDRGIEHREPVALHAIAAQELDLHTAAGGGRRIAVTRRLDECWVDGDPALLTQLVTNLVTNAVRHNVDGGTLGVDTHPERGLSVANTGPPIDPDTVPELFEPFRRGAGRTATDEGAGLGLSIVRSIVRAHGGTVDATPRQGGGLTVRVRLPTAERPMAR